MKDFLKSLFGSVKKLIAIMLTLVFCYLSIVDRIAASDFMTIFVMVIGAYFGQSIAKNSKA